MGAGLGGAGLLPAGLGGGEVEVPTLVLEPEDPPAVPQGTELAQQTGHVAKGLGLRIEQFK